MCACVLQWRLGCSITRHPLLSLSMLKIVPRWRETHGGHLQGLFHCRIGLFVSAAFTQLWAKWGGPGSHSALKEGLLHHKTPLPFPVHAHDCAKKKGEKRRNFQTLSFLVYIDILMLLLIVLKHFKKYINSNKSHLPPPDPCKRGKSTEFISAENDEEKREIPLLEYCLYYLQIQEILPNTLTFIHCIISNL